MIEIESFIYSKSRSLDWIRGSIIFIFFKERKKKLELKPKVLLKSITKQQ